MISLEACINYLREAFGQDAIVPTPEHPPFEWLSMTWQMSMEVYELRFFGQEFVLAVLLTKPTFKDLIGLETAFRRNLKIPFAFAFEENESLVSGLLAAHDVPHLIPKHRLFFPALGMLYREQQNRRERRCEKTESRLSKVRLSSAGRVILEKIIDDSREPERRHVWENPIQHQSLKGMIPMDVDGIHGALPSSPAALTRVFQQFEDLGLGNFVGHGPRTRFQFRPRWELWRQLVRSEVETVLNEKKIKVACPVEKISIPFVYAGSSALAHLGCLTEPAVSKIAVMRSAFLNWPSSEQQQFEGIPVDVQIWRYLPPSRMGHGGRPCLAPMSLALTMRQTEDPRERAILSELLENEDLDPSYLWEVK